jgi:hypothetical protein
MFRWALVVLYCLMQLSASAIDYCAGTEASERRASTGPQFALSIDDHGPLGLAEQGNEGHFVSRLNRKVDKKVLTLVVRRSLRQPALFSVKRITGFLVVVFFQGNDLFLCLRNLRI